MTQLELFPKAQWADQALHILEQYAMHSRTFMVEDVREYAHNDCGLPLPTDGRAWGVVVQKAVRKGSIMRVGHAPMKSRNCHGDHKAVWQWVDA